jgi:hypothetical protein
MSAEYERLRRQVALFGEASLNDLDRWRFRSVSVSRSPSVPKTSAGTVLRFFPVKVRRSTSSVVPTRCMASEEQVRMLRARLVN